MRAFGESLVAYRPPIDTRSVSEMRQIPPNGFPEKALNFLTPHQKWGIHSTYSENLLMLTLSRGGPIVWISETDARELTIVDNDWVEVFNANGALTARAVVSQRTAGHDHDVSRPGTHYEYSWFGSNWHARRHS